MDVGVSRAGTAPETAMPFVFYAHYPPLIGRWRKKPKSKPTASSTYLAASCIQAYSSKARH